MMSFRRLSACLLFLFLSLGTLASVAQAQQMVSVARETVNMRSAPGTRSTVQWALSRGYPLQVVARKGAWLQVRDFEGDRGWVLRSLTGRTPHHVVKAKVANLRGAPGTRARIVGKAFYGDVLRTVERRGEWVRVRHGNGRSGWIARRLLWGW
jgi:SH3-like domain-containing protein